MPVAEYAIPACQWLSMLSQYASGSVCYPIMPVAEYAIPACQWLNRLSQHASGSVYSPSMHVDCFPSKQMGNLAKSTCHSSMVEYFSVSYPSMQWVESDILACVRDHSLPTTGNINGDGISDYKHMSHNPLPLHFIHTTRTVSETRDWCPRRDTGVSDRFEQMPCSSFCLHNYCWTRLTCTSLHA